ncbi:MAG: translation initiation factor IF-2 [Thermoplasmata archaeon]|nr:translation initiation factor IF-2 [Thermoplasmata archaeon]MCK5396939.1 translation initiation factor IF-2 [Thermoplasmata archaeon]
MEECKSSIRQPIVSVLGHVDHGKTSLLDYIRGSTVVSREAGAITQHIGATEVPVEAIYKVCGPLMKKQNLSIPGLLFIDTPGHHSFTTLRSRGGTLADMAILVIDINEGLKPQTIESINILKRAKTPFIVALNKVDLTYGWRAHKGEPFIISVKKQNKAVQQLVEKRIYDIVGKLYDMGFSADRYDKISDFTKNMALVPMSAKTGEGVADILTILVGLAQRFLEEALWTDESGPGEGTILEIKEEKGLGPTMDVILYKGSMNKGDTIVLGTSGIPKVTKVKAILKPKPLDEIRDPRERFDSVECITAASGVKLVAQDITGAVAGGIIRVANIDLECVVDELGQESQLCIETQEDGVIVKADAIGSLEGLAFEAKDKEIPIRKAEIGDISRRDIIETAAKTDPTRRVIFAFNVNVLPDAKEALLDNDVKLIQGDIVYKLIEDYEEWLSEKKRELETDSRKEMVYPGKMKILPDCIFRVSKPAIVGVRILAGRIRIGQRLIREDGREVGKIKSIRSGDDTKKEAISGAEVAVAIDGATCGRQIDVDMILYVDIPGSHCKELNKMDLNFDEKDVLEQVCIIKRKDDKFWGM